MNLTQVTQELSEKLLLPTKTVKTVITGFLGLVEEKLKAGEKAVTINNFGKFRVVNYKPRGQPYRVVGFKNATRLKKSMQEGMKDGKAGSPNGQANNP